MVDRKSSAGSHVKSAESGSSESSLVASEAGSGGSGGGGGGSGSSSGDAARNGSRAVAVAGAGGPSGEGDGRKGSSQATPLTRERILEAAEDTLRRFGPGKTTVVDVARALGVSHGTVYRHFASKTELRDSVLEQWLERRIAPLSPIVEEREQEIGQAGLPSPAAERLHRWLVALMESKREEARNDPDLFAAYAELSAQSREVILRHIETLVGQVTRIISSGAAAGEFAVADPAIAARSVFDSTSRFHHPAHASEWTQPDIDECFDGVWSLILTGLSPR
jgi:AcrR family transcriptional regulator